MSRSKSRNFPNYHWLQGIITLTLKDKGILFEHSFPQSGNNLHISGQSLSEKALVTLYSCNEPNIFDIFRTVQPDLILVLLPCQVLGEFWYYSRLRHRQGLRWHAGGQTDMSGTRFELGATMLYLAWAELAEFDGSYICWTRGSVRKGECTSASVQSSVWAPVGLIPHGCP